MKNKILAVQTTIQSVGFSEKWIKEISDTIEDSNKRIARAYNLVNQLPDLMNVHLREIGEIHDQTGVPYHTISRLISAAKKEGQRNASRS